jgi:hypothetical protein
MEKTLTIELPEAPVDAYLRLVSWWCDFRIAATETPVFRDVAEARGIAISTSDAELLFLGLLSTASAACAAAVAEGRSTATPTLTLPLHIWHVGARTAEASLEATKEMVASGRVRAPDEDAEAIRQALARKIEEALGYGSEPDAPDTGPS